MEKKTTFYVESSRARDFVESTMPVKRRGDTYSARY